MLRLNQEPSPRQTPVSSSLLPFLTSDSRIAHPLPPLPRLHALQNDRQRCMDGKTEQDTGWLEREGERERQHACQKGIERAGSPPGLKGAGADDSIRSSAQRQVSPARAAQVGRAPSLASNCASPDDATATRGIPRRRLVCFRSYPECRVSGW